MEKQMKWPVKESTPPALVEYHSEGQILRIENGQKSAVGEDMSENIIVHYDKDDETFASVVAIRIDQAEHVLKPFVDAILAKYGVKREPGQDTAEESSRRTPFWAIRSRFRRE